METEHKMANTPINKLILQMSVELDALEVNVRNAVKTK